jgi:uncharacterized membrane-anchored protein
MISPNETHQNPESEPQDSQPISDAKNSGQWWKFAVPLVLQTALILAVTAQAVYTHLTGTTVILETRPVDPYDMMRGYYQTLSYKISDTNTLKKLPGWKEIAQANSYPSTSQTFYIVMAKPANPKSTLTPSPWQPIKISRDRPKDLEQNQVAIQGEYISEWQIIYGLETYYMPEDQRIEINEQIGQAQRQPQAFVVEIKVDRSGNAVPVSLWVRDRNYQF